MREIISVLQDTKLGEKYYDFKDKVKDVNDNLKSYLEAEVGYLNQVVKTSITKMTWVVVALVVAFTLALNLMFTLSLAFVFILPDYVDISRGAALGIYVAALFLILGGAGALIWLNFKKISGVLNRYLNHWSDT